MNLSGGVGFGQYVSVDSFVHRLDPRVKILGVILLIVGVFLSSSLVNYGIWAVFFVFLVWLSKLSFGMVLRSVRMVLYLLIFTALINLFFVPGEEIWRWRFLSITKEGVQMAYSMGLRLVLLVLFANLLTFTTTPLEISDGLESLLSPFKRFGLPAHELAMMMTIAMRFIPTLLGETQRIMKAQLARGADLERGSVVRRMRMFLPVLIPLFVIVFQRADDLAVAMESRCYRGGEGRVRMRPFVWRFSDSVALFFCFGVLGAQVLVKSGGFW